MPVAASHDRRHAIRKAAFLGRSPDIASFEDVRRFQLHLTAKRAHIPTLNHTVAALRFFFRVKFKQSTSSSIRRSSMSPASCLCVPRTPSVAEA